MNDGERIKKSGHFHHSALKTHHFRVGILTCSTVYAHRKGDLSGEVIRKLLQSKNKEKASFKVEKYEILPDDFKKISSLLKNWCDKAKLDLILTAGGTGFSPTDITPEATKSVLDREAPGLSEAMRIFSSGPLVTGHQFHLSFLSRGVCGIRKKTLILNLPGSARGAKECLGVVLPILPHALALING